MFLGKFSVGFYIVIGKFLGQFFRRKLIVNHAITGSFTGNSILFISISISHAIMAQRPYFVFYQATSRREPRVGRFSETLDYEQFLFSSLVLRVSGKIIGGKNIGAARKLWSPLAPSFRAASICCSSRDGLCWERGTTRRYGNVMLMKIPP